MERTILGANRPENGKKKHYRLTQTQLTTVHAGVDDALATLGLDRFPPQQQHRSLQHGLTVENNTRQAYDNHLRGLFYFFGLIGDYESLIILLPDAPSNVPAMNLDSIRNH